MGQEDNLTGIEVYRMTGYVVESDGEYMEVRVKDPQTGKVKELLFRLFFLLN